MGRLYTAVRLFHPYLGYKGIDWDAAVAHALPAIGQAENREDYRAAVETLLAVLDDPATRVVDLTVESRQGRSARDTLLASWLGDTVLVIRLLASDNPDVAGLTEALDGLDSLVRRSQAVIIDLRAPEGWHSGGMTEFLLSESRLPAVLLPASVVTPSERTRIHEGYPPDDPSRGSSFYRNGWHVPSGSVIAGGDSTAARPVTFLVNPWSELPSLALAARAAGVGRVIGETQQSRALGATTRRIPIGDGLAVALRVGELISSEGTAVPTVDTVLPRATNDDDPSLRLALRWSVVAEPARRAPGAALPVSIWPGPPASNASGHPTAGQRLVGLFRLWGAIAYFHAYPEPYERSWGALLEQFIPRVERARDSVTYAMAIAELVTHLRDSHGHVRAPGLQALFGGARLPLAARMIEGRPVITSLDADSLAPGARVGDEIVRIDGEPILTRLKRLGKYISASTEDAWYRDALAAALLGDTTVAVLQVRRADARLRTLRIRRRPAPVERRPERAGPVFEVLPGNIGYVDLDRLPGDLVDSMFSVFQRTKGIIFDMRGYPKGTAWLIAPRLTDRAGVPAAQFTERMARGPRGVLGFETDEALARSFLQYLPTLAGETYRGWTVMLMDERTQSQAEHTGLFLKAANNTRLVGSRTAGADGDVTNVALPGNILVWFTGMAVHHPDGRPLQRTGLTPDIPVKPTLRGVRAGRDEVLERALTYLRRLPPRRGAR
jgi:C-terminal processing protease CtpA/Prc